MAKSGLHMKNGFENYVTSKNNVLVSLYKQMLKKINCENYILGNHRDIKN